jgi:predicted Zn-dependent protease
VVDDQIAAALERHPAIHDWTLRARRRRGAQLYLTGDRLEAARTVERVDREVEVCNDHPDPGDGGAPVRGSMTIPLAADDLSRLPRLLDQAVAMARLIHNPPWEPPGPQAWPEVELADPVLGNPDGPVRVGREAAERVRTLVERERSRGVEMAAAELFVDDVEETIVTSRAVRGTASATRLLLELVLLATSDEGEAEHLRQVESRRVDDLRLEETVALAAERARAAIGARPPVTRQGPVVLADQAIRQAMTGTAVNRIGCYLFHADASSAHAGMSRFTLGESVYAGGDPNGDRLTLRANARRPYGLHSYRFDPDGVPAHDLLVIEAGILRARPATARYAQYLGLPATGVPGVMEIAPGPTPRADLLAPGDAPLLEVVAFAAPSVDVATGNFGMEIRLGYEHGRDGVRPVRGGSVSGNLFDAMADARFSAEVVDLGGYVGPQAVRFASLQVSGAD